MTFKPVLQLSDNTGGLNTKQRANKIAINECQSIVSMDFDANTMRRAKGFTLLGDEADAALTGKSLYTHRILAGQEVLIKTIGSYIKFLDTVDNKWYKLTDAAFTSGLRWSFASFNSFLYGNNGTDNWIFWKGSTMTTIMNAVDNTSSVIDLPSGKGALYPSSGTVMVQDEAISYTGKTGDQLTGCSITQSHPAGSTIILKLDSTTYSSLQKASQIIFHKNRLYMIDAETPTIIRHSKLADNTSPETDLVDFTIAGSGSGDAGYGIAPDRIIALKELVNGNQSTVLAAFCENGIVYAFSVTDSSAGTTTNAFTPLRTMNAYPQANQLVEVVENDLAFVDQNGHVRTLFYGDVNNPLQVRTIANKIEPSLEATDFANGAIKYHNRKLYIVGKSSGLSVNDLAYYHDENYHAWGAYKHWDIAALEVYNDKLVGLSEITGNVYTLNNGYSVYVDDSSENNEGVYYSEFVKGDIDFGYPLQMKRLNKLRVSGFITSNAEVYIDFFFDNSSKYYSFLLSGDNTNIIGSSNPNIAIGTVVFGSGVLGGSIPGGGSRKEFWAELRFNDYVNFLKTKIRVRCESKNVDFEFNDIVLWAKLLGANFWLPQKVLQLN